MYITTELLLRWKHQVERMARRLGCLARDGCRVELLKVRDRSNNEDNINNEDISISRIKQITSVHVVNRMPCSTSWPGSTVLIRFTVHLQLDSNCSPPEPFHYCTCWMPETSCKSDQSNRCLAADTTALCLEVCSHCSNLLSLLIMCRVSTASEL